MKVIQCDNSLHSFEMRWYAQMGTHQSVLDEAVATHSAYRRKAEEKVTAAGTREPLGAGTRGSLQHKGDASSRKGPRQRQLHRDAKHAGGGELLAAEAGGVGGKGGLPCRAAWQCKEQRRLELTWALELILAAVNCEG